MFKLTTVLIRLSDILYPEMPKPITTCSFIVFLATLASCTGPSTERPRINPIPVRDCCRAALSEARHDAIVRTATELVGARTIESGDRRIAYDCAGVIRAVYLAHGIDLYDGVHQNSQANGVRLIYDHVRAHGRIHRGPVVRAGDLVFFDNTRDADGNGRDNDPLTHVGVVEKVESDGTIVFISRVSEAIQRYRMNLAHPQTHRHADGRILNDYLRRKRWSDQKSTRYLTGELFAAFGTRVAS